MNHTKAISILSVHAQNICGAIGQQQLKTELMQEEYEALELAIKLLQQEEPTEPCYYCRDLDGENNYQRGTLYRKGEEITSVPAKRCMNCGRLLKGKQSCE